MTEQLPANLQRNVLTALIFSPTHGKLLRNCLPIECWMGDPTLLSLIKSVYSYIDTYDQPPFEHIYDLLEGLQFNQDQKDIVKSVLITCEVDHSNLNLEFVLNMVEKFHRFSTLRAAIQDSIELLEKGKIAEVEEKLHASLKKRLEVFDKGLRLSDVVDRLLDKRHDQDCIRLNIAALDNKEINPFRKELFLICAPAGYGKSWGLVYIAKQALLENKKVLYLTLEMDETRSGTRFLQSLYSRGLHEEYQATTYSIDADDLIVVPFDNSPRITDDNQLFEIGSLLARDKYIDNNLIVKQFPTNSLTMSELNAYLDSLEMLERFIPDVLIIDYIDLMHIKDPKNNRLEIAQMYKNVRRLCVERNLIGVSASQINRDGSKKAKSDGTDIAEAYDKIATADNCLIYNCTELERQYGFARLFVTKARNSRDKFEILITQNYNTGQFVIDSAEVSKVLRANYKTLISELEAA